MNFTESVTSCFTKYITFSGRARRSEFWWFVLFGIVGGFLTGVIDGVIFSPGIDEIGPINGVFNLILFLPSISVAVRRLHDTGKSGWWWWLWLIPVIGWIILIVWYANKGTEGTNQFGDDPFDDLGHPDGDDGGEPYAASPIPVVKR